MRSLNHFRRLTYLEAFGNSKWELENYDFTGFARWQKPSVLFSTQTCQNSHATHMRMQQDSPHGFQRAIPFCNNNRQACHLPRAYCAKRVLGYSSLSSASLNSFHCFVQNPFSFLCDNSRAVIKAPFFTCNRTNGPPDAPMTRSSAQKKGGGGNRPYDLDLGRD